VDEVLEGVVVGRPSCDRCGATVDVQAVIDPYALELDSIEVWIDLCPPCLAYRYEEI